VTGHAVLLAIGLALAGCGGGGGGGWPGVVNTAPSYISPAAATVAENTSGTIYTATASDAQGDSVAYAIAGGADAAQFQISPAGALSFRTAPDFEVPADTGGDNVYEVTLSASDGAAQRTLALRVAVTDETGGPFAVRLVGTGALTNVVGFGEDEAGNLHIVSIGGSVFAILPAH
jgi:hypothetical protein